MPLLVLLAIAVGIVLPVQAGVNAQLRQYLTSPIATALVSFGVGTVALLVLCVALRLSVPPSSTLSRIPWWLWTGGLCGAIYIASAVVLAPRLGAAALIASVVTGQMLASLVLDHYGLLGYPVHPVSALRALGAVLVALGVLFVQRG